MVVGTKNGKLLLIGKKNQIKQARVITAKIDMEHLSLSQIFQRNLWPYLKQNLYLKKFYLKLQALQV